MDAPKDSKKTRRRKANPVDPAKIDRLPPHSPKTEQAVLGCILWDPAGCLGPVQETFAPEAFYDIRHRMIYQAMLALSINGALFDTVSLCAHLSDHKQLTDAGGYEYVSTLQDATPGPASLVNYLPVLREKWMRRQAITAAMHVVGAAWEETETPIDQFVSDAQEKLFALSQDRVDTCKHAKSLVLESADYIEHTRRGIGMITGLASGFSYWDRMTGGLHPGEMSVLGGRPSTGKTSLAMCVAERVAVDGGNPVAVLSLEMSGVSIMTRLMCSRARANMHKLRTGFPIEAEKPALNLAGVKLAQAPLWIDDCAELGWLQMRSKLRRLVRQHQIRLAIIDYLQLIEGEPGLEHNPARYFGKISKAIKASAKELNIPILVLSQLNRESDKDHKRRPRMSDLRESGAIEQDADFIGILFRDYTRWTEEQEIEMRATMAKDPHAQITLPVTMEICKQRNGPTGDVHFNFHRWCMRFEDLQRVSKPDAHEEEL